MAKKSESLPKIFAYHFLILVIIGLVTYWLSNTLNAVRFVKYAGFDISIPINYAIHGIDISHHQGNINWQEVKTMQDRNIKIGFAFIKATEGVGMADETFKKNWFNAKLVNIPRGAYHFFNPSKNGKEQANNFTDQVVLQNGDLPPVLDVETINGVSKNQLQQRVKEWLSVVEKYYNTKPIIYTNVDFYENYLKGVFDDYPLWVAHYLVNDKPRTNKNWIFWQHNEKGHVNGIDAFVDFNVFSGDSSSFKKLFISKTE